MSGLSAEELNLFVEQLTRLLAERSGEADVRRVMEDDAGFDPALWAQLSEMGLTGLVIAAEHGGAGAGPVELERAMEVAGAALLCSPLLSNSVLAPGFVAALGDVSEQARLLPSMASGDVITTLALTGPGGRWRETDIAVEAVATGSDWSLTGKACFVTHAQVAQRILVLAVVDGDLAAFEVDATAPGLDVAPLPTFDKTLRMADLSFADCKARRLASSGSVWAAAQAAMDLALVALAGEQAGGARRVLEFTVDYVKNRYQFGRAIGSFQAVKHMAADLLLESESCTSAARNAARRLAEGGQDAPAAISLAAFACADAYCQVTATSIQMHGGIAFNWSNPAHLYLRRARASAQLFGSPEHFRDLYVQQLGDAA